MYLSSFALRGIKCFDAATFEFPRRRDGRHAGWHVLLGANATGKSTALQAMAVSLIGPSAWAPLITPVGWVRSEARHEVGAFEAVITKGPQDVADRAQKGPFTAKVTVTPDALVEVYGESFDTPQFVPAPRHKAALLKSVYATKKRGWFACGYGPFRRLSGGSYEALTNLSLPRQHRTASLFREAIALTQCEPWLRDLHHRASDLDDPAHAQHARTFEAIKDVVNALLPGGVRLDEVSARGVRFASAGGRRVALAELSDGYRSFLALVLDILRHLVDANDGDLDGLTSQHKEQGEARTRVTVEGVVLIDEVDAHLHPRWQREIGHMLQAAFPNVQFIVSSHSPFVAQAASDGGLFVLRPAAGSDAVEVVRPVETVRGWRAEAILTSELFGLEDTVDVETEALLADYRALSGKRALKKLTPAERRKLDALEAQLARALTAPGESREEYVLRQDAEAYIQKTLRAIKSAG